MKVDKILEVFKNLVLKVKSLSTAQAIAAVTAAAVAVGGVGTGSYFIYENSHQPQETIADVAQETEAETEELPSEELEDVIIADVVVVADETEAAEAEERVLTLVATSLEKDLKIKIQDQNSKLVTGIVFVVSVAENKNGAKTTSYQDDDKDGIIYIENIKGGDYRVVLEEIEGYTIKTGSITVTVKDQLEYKRVDVASEIKSESQVNTAVEDTAVNNVPVEAVLTDTLPLLESSVTTTTVSKDQVDTSNFTRATASGSNTKDFKGMPVVVEGPDTGDQNSGDTGDQNSGDAGDQNSGNTGDDQHDESNVEGGTGDSEGQNLDIIAFVEKNRTIRVASAPNNIATVSLPETVTLYNVENAASMTYTITPVVSGNASVIEKIEWGIGSSAYELTLGSNNSVTIKYTGNGSGQGDLVANVFYKNSEGQMVSEKMTVVVQISNMTDTSTVLKDKSGNILYVDSAAKTRATLSNYASASVFYTAPQYTGWQTLDGKVYYYDANHNAATGNQIIGGVTYTFAADGSLSQSSGSRGIDVSKYQGRIDWGAVAASGINFAIIRVGYRGATTGALIEDPYFRSNIAGATRAGIKVGVYFFTQAVTEAEAVEEASMVLSLISGYKVTYPVFIDSESATNGRANGLDTATRTAVVKAFCQTIANSGYRPGVYASKNWFGSRLNASALSNYCIWVAQYNTSCTYSGKYDMWQYTSSGTVPGINGRVDMNTSYMNY